MLSISSYQDGSAADFSSIGANDLSVASSFETLVPERGDYSAVLRLAVQQQPDATRRPGVVRFLARHNQIEAEIERLKRPVGNSREYEGLVKAEASWEGEKRHYFGLAAKHDDAIEEHLADKPTGLAAVIGALTGSLARHDKRTVKLRNLALGAQVAADKCRIGADEAREMREAMEPLEIERRERITRSNMEQIKRLNADLQANDFAALVQLRNPANGEADPKTLIALSRDEITRREQAAERERVAQQEAAKLDMQAPAPEQSAPAPSM